jgi:hypothetical protein
LDTTNYTPHLQGFDLQLASKKKKKSMAQNVGTNFLKAGVYMYVKLIHTNIQDCGTMLTNEHVALIAVC